MGGVCTKPNGKLSPKTLDVEKDAKGYTTDMKKLELVLQKKENLTIDTRRFTFGLPSKDEVLGLPIGQHVMLSAEINGEIVKRPYTPVSDDDKKGVVQLVIKVYFAPPHPKSLERFPDGGKLTQYLEKNLEVGKSSITVEGPRGRVLYTGPGEFSVKPDYDSPPVMKTCKKLGMIAGGSGITPLYQLIQHVLKDPNDKTEMWLLYANQTNEDILLRDELEKMRAANGKRLHLHFTIDKFKESSKEKEWKYSKGHINKDMIEGNLPTADAADTLVAMCGPPGMIDNACIPNLEALNHQPDRFFKY